MEVEEEEEEEETIAESSELTAEITEISDLGVVKILFSTEIYDLTNLTSYDNDVIELFLAERDYDYEKEDIEFTWEATKFEGNILSIQLNFSNPYAISQYQAVIKYFKLSFFIYFLL